MSEVPRGARYNLIPLPRFRLEYSIKGRFVKGDYLRCLVASFSHPPALESYLGATPPVPLFLFGDKPLSKISPVLRRVYREEYIPKES